MSDGQGDDHRDGSRAGGSDRQGREPRAGTRKQSRTARGVGDVFSTPETLAEIKLTALTYAVVGIGFAVVAAGIGTFGAGSIGTIAVSATLLLSVVPILLSPILAVVHGFRHVARLDDQPDNVVFATTAAGNALGVLALFLVGTVFALAAASPGSRVGRSVGDAIVPMVVVMVGVAIVGAGTAWATRRLTPDSESVVEPPEDATDPARNR